MDTTSDTSIKQTIRVFHIVSPFSSNYVMVNTIDKPPIYSDSTLYTNIALLIAKFVPMNKAIKDFPNALVNLIDFDNKTAKYVRADDGYKRNARPNRVYGKKVLDTIVKIVHSHTNEHKDIIRDRYKLLVNKCIFDTSIVKVDVPHIDYCGYYTLYNLAIMYPFCTVNDVTDEWISGELIEVFPELCTPRSMMDELEYLNRESKKMISEDVPTTLVAKNI